MKVAILVAVGFKLRQPHPSEILAAAKAARRGMMLVRFSMSSTLGFSRSCFSPRFCESPPHTELVTVTVVVEVVLVLLLLAAASLEMEGRSYTTMGVIVVVDVFVPGTFRYDRQKVLAGGPIFFSTPRHPVNLEQSTARLSRFANAVGSGQAVAIPLTVAASKSFKATMFLDFD